MCVCDHVVVYRRGGGAVLLRCLLAVLLRCLLAVLLRCLLAWAIREDGGCVFCVYVWLKGFGEDVGSVVFG